MADFNKNELILDRVRSLVTHDIATGKLLFRLTSLEEPSLQCTAEGEEVTDAIGAVITTLYRAKKATFSATNSLISLDLAAHQYGTEKKVASSTSKIVDWTYEILTVSEGKVTLKHEPIKDNETSTLKYIYSVVGGEIGTAYTAAATAPTKEDDVTFSISGSEITLPSSLNGSKVYVEYQYETEKAIGKIICPRAKLNPEQVELALTSTGKHAFEFTMMKDYCSDEGEDKLFTIIVAQD